jgi:hypothetical protein
MPAHREPLARKKQSLGYLCEDLERKLSKLRGWDEIEDVDERQLDEVLALAKEIAQLDIGFERKLNDLQYLLGEMQVYMWEWSGHYQRIDDCIAQIQDFLDWDLDL